MQTACGRILSHYDFEHEWPGKINDAKIIFPKIAESGTDYIHISTHKGLVDVFDSKRNLASLAKEYSGITVVGCGGLHDHIKAQKVVEDAHAKWTAEWLAWEHHHDADFRKRTSVLEAELQAAGQEHTPDGHARIAALEDEKLQSYQRRYEEYVQVGKGLTDLLEGSSK